MKTIAAILIVLESQLTIQCMAGDEPDVSQILRMIGQKEPTQTISIDFQCDCYVSASWLPRDDISLRASKIRKEFPQSEPGQPDDPKMEAAFEQLADDYTTGAENGANVTTTTSTLILSKDFIALYTLESPDFPSEWEVRKGNTYYRYIVSNEAASIRDKSNGQCEDTLEVAVGSVGLLGLLPKNPSRTNIVSIDKWDKWLTELNVESLSVWREGPSIHLSKGPEEITVEDLGRQQYRLRSFECDSPNTPQFEKTSFDSYTTFGGCVLPCKVRDVLCNPSTNLVRVYTVKGIHHGDEIPLVPFVNADLPSILIDDTRFSPQINYRVVSKLPSDEKIAEWVKDPAALKRYNAMMW